MKIPVVLSKSETLTAPQTTLQAGDGNFIWFAELRHARVPGETMRPQKNGMIPKHIGLEWSGSQPLNPRVHEDWKETQPHARSIAQIMGHMEGWRHQPMSVMQQKVHRWMNEE